MKNIIILGNDFNNFQKKYKTNQITFCSKFEVQILQNEIIVIDNFFENLSRRKMIRYLNILEKAEIIKEIIIIFKNINQNIKNGWKLLLVFLKIVLWK